MGQAPDDLLKPSGLESGFETNSSVTHRDLPGEGEIQEEGVDSLPSSREVPNVHGRSRT